MPKSKKAARAAGLMVVVNLLRGRDISAVVELAKAFLAGEKPSLNKGVMSPTAWKKHLAEREEAIKTKAKRIPPPINIYQPPVVQYANSIGAEFAFQTETPLDKKPKDWNENQLGPWEGGRMGDCRAHHESDARTLVVNREEDIVKVGRLGEFVVGTGVVSAIHRVHLSITGCFRAIHRATKEIGADGVKGLDRIVAHINNKVVTITCEDGSEIVFLPNQIMTWGYLHRGANTQPMTYHQIRELGEDADGITFKELEAPIRLGNVDLGKLASRVEKIMSFAETKDPETHKTDWDRFNERKPRSEKKRKPAEVRIAENAGTICRVNPQVVRCNGLRGLQLGMPIFTCFEGATAEKAKAQVAVTIGARLTSAYSERSWEFNRRIAPPKPVVEKGKKGKGKKGAAVTDAPGAENVETTEKVTTRQRETANA